MRAASLLLLRGDESLPVADFSPATPSGGGGRRAVVHDTRGELKVVGVVDAPRLGGRLVGVIFLTDGYGPLRTAAKLLASRVAACCRHRWHAGVRQPRVDTGRPGAVLGGAAGGGW